MKSSDRWSSSARKSTTSSGSQSPRSGDNGAGMTYVPTEKNLIPFYQHVAKNTSLRVLVYNGDTDPCVSYEGTRAAIKMVGFKVCHGLWTCVSRRLDVLAMCACMRCMAM